MLVFHFHLTGGAEHDKLFINRFVFPVDVAGFSLAEMLIEGGIFNGTLPLSASLNLLWCSTGHKRQAGDEGYPRRVNSACFLLIWSSMKWQG